MPEKVFPDGLSADLFACCPVNDYPLALAWYTRLFGCPPAFFPTAIEAVWEIAEHRYIYIELIPKHAGHAKHLIFLSDFDGFISQLEQRGLNPAKRETLPNGVRKIVFHDPDGNEMGFGGAPVKS